MDTDLSCPEFAVESSRASVAIPRPPATPSSSASPEGAHSKNSSKSGCDEDQCAICLSSLIGEGPVVRTKCKVKYAPGHVNVSVTISVISARFPHAMLGRYARLQVGLSFMSH
jgi:hypothetical protein